MPGIQEKEDEYPDKNKIDRDLSNLKIKLKSSQSPKIVKQDVSPVERPSLSERKQVQ